MSAPRFKSSIATFGSMSIINTEKAAAPVGAYPHAKKVGNLLFLSGIGPREPESNNIPEGIEAQVHSMFRNVKAVLEAAGARWEQLVDITVFLTNMKDDFKTFNEVYATYFRDNQPCRTTVGVVALPTPILVEVKCIAEVK